MKLNVKNLFSRAHGALKKVSAGMLCLVLTLSLFVVYLLTACEKPIEIDTDSNTDIGTDTVEHPLINSTWKLVGIFNTETNAPVKELEPKHCEECYTLAFNTDSAATVRSINKVLDLDLLNLGLPDSVFIDAALFCERYYKDGKDYCDSDDFRRAIITAKSYIVTANELQLFFRHNEDRYLLFKPL